MGTSTGHFRYWSSAHFISQTIELLTPYKALGQTDNLECVRYESFMRQPLRICMRYIYGFKTIYNPVY